jgi:NADH dehydrogenase
MKPAGRHPHRVVIVGAGFGGLFATKALRRAPVEVTLIDRSGQHLFQPLLYQVATGILSEGEIAPPIRDVLRRQRNARVLLGEVTTIDFDTRTVTSHAGRELTVTPYDSLIVATGSGQSYFGNDRFARYAPGLKSIADALQHRGRIFGAFEFAELAADPAERDAWMSFVVVGAGPTGVEMAGQLAELSHRSLHGNYRAIDPARARVVLVEAGHAVLANYGPRLSGKAHHGLRRLGVDVLLQAKVIGVDADGVDIATPTGPERISARTVVWAAGVAASPLGGLLARAAGAELNRSGQVAVEPDCTLPGRPEVFVIGDLMHLPAAVGVAQVAIQSGRFAAHSIQARLRGRRPPAQFRYRDKGMLATISRFRAVAAIGPLKISGVPAWVLWLAVHLFYLIGFKNRFSVLMHWTISFLGRGRSERTAIMLDRPADDAETPLAVEPSHGAALGAAQPADVAAP